MSSTPRCLVKHTGKTLTCRAAAACSYMYMFRTEGKMINVTAVMHVIDISHYGNRMKISYINMHYKQKQKVGTVLSEFCNLIG